MATNVVDVYVKLQSGKAITSNFLPSDTVARIAAFVARHEGVPETRVRLKYQGKTLDKKHSIGYLGIRPETILKGEIIVPKDLDLYVNLPEGRCEKINALSTDTVADLKTKIQSAEGLPPYKQKLVVKGGGNISNEGSRMLCDVGVGKETVIDLTEVVAESSTAAKTKDSSKSADDSSAATQGPTPDLDEDKKQELMCSFDAAGRNVEVAFCFDTTGSMYSCLDTVRRKLRETCERLLRDVPQMRIAIMAHGDYCDYDNYVERHVDLTSDVDVLVDFAENVPKTGGGDSPECYEWALRKCQQLDWSENSAKAFVMIGDCLPHPPSYTDQSIYWGTELDVLIGMGVKVYGVQALNNHESTPFYKELSDRSGGFYLQLKHFSLITDMFLAVCYREADPGQLDAFIEEVEQEGRLTGETKILLEKLDEAPKAKEERKPSNYVKASWWDSSLDSNRRPSYMYVQETDSWKPYRDSSNDSYNYSSSSSAVSPSYSPTYRIDTSDRTRKHSKIRKFLCWSSD